MRRHLEIWQPALFAWVIILVLRYEMLIKVFLSLPEAGYGIIIEFILFIFLPFIIFLFREKASFIRSGVKFYNLAGLILLYLFLFAGIISDRDPDFQKDLSVTKLLPPLSTVKVLHIKAADTENRKTFSLRKSYNESVIFIDSILYKESWIYYQKHRAVGISGSKIEFQDGKPHITKAIFILGTDALGRDVFTRLVYGVRTSLIIGICASFISFIIGVIIGFTAGYYEGFANLLLSRIVDVLLSFPVVILIILIVALFGNSILALILTLGFTGWMGLFKIVKSELILLKTRDYFITSRLIGSGNVRLIVKDALPVFIIPAITNFIFQINNVIMAESSLSYLGLGIGSIYPSWGAMIQSGQEYLTNAWWLIFFPAFMLILTLHSVRGFGNRINTYFNPGLQNDK